MRKTIVLAYATAALAVVAIVTDLVRADIGTPTGKEQNPVVQVQTDGGQTMSRLRVRSSEAI